MIHINSYIIGIAGASGAGKSVLALRIQNSLNDRALVIFQDNFYKNLDHYTPEQRTLINFDHPDAIEFDLLISKIKDLMRGKETYIPLYDFSIHNRKKEQMKIIPKNFIIVEGTLLFTNERLRQLFNLKIFIDTPLDICFIRRMTRDCRERTRSVASVVQQYLQTVRPMYLKYIRPSRKFADMIVDGSNEMSELKFRQIVQKITNCF